MLQRHDGFWWVTEAAEVAGDDDSIDVYNVLEERPFNFLFEIIFIFFLDLFFRQINFYFMAYVLINLDHDEVMERLALLQRLI